MENNMINKLVDKIKKTNAPVVVGLDPMLKYIPEHIKKAAFSQYGETLEGAAEAVWQFNKAIVDCIYDIVPAVKPQVAMYEQFGVPGMSAFKKTVDYCKQKDLVVIGDVKRGDIGSTSEAYAVAHLGKVTVGNTILSAFDEDFATVNPYLGSDGINPFLKVCQEEKKGIFILVKTSNPSSGEFQDRIIDGRPLYEIVGEKVFNQIHLDVSKYFEYGRNQILRIALKNDIKYAIFKDGSPSDGVHKIYDGTFSRNKIPGKGRVTSLLEENNIKVYSEDEVDLFIQEVLVRN